VQEVAHVYNMSGQDGDVISTKEEIEDFEEEEEGKIFFTSVTDDSLYSFTQYLISIFQHPRVIFWMVFCSLVVRCVQERM
jgi:hypothetical protein